MFDFSLIPFSLWCSPPKICSRRLRNTMEACHWGLQREIKYLPLPFKSWECPLDWIDPAEGLLWWKGCSCNFFYSPLPCCPQNHLLCCSRRFVADLWSLGDLEAVVNWQSSVSPNYCLSLIVSLSLRHWPTPCIIHNEQEMTFGSLFIFLFNGMEQQENFI